jgi:hypothetical protein
MAPFTAVDLNRKTGLLFNYVRAQKTRAFRKNPGFSVSEDRSEPHFEEKP